MWTREDIEFMRRAITLAQRGEGAVSPNPMVGAVIVRDGRVLAEGWHRKYGGLHAETDALSSCSADPSGAVMYVTLEPCCHHGKQPPCTDAIIRAGISRVVVGMTDPNPLVAGKGIEILRDSGIEVETGLLESEIRRQNRVFVKFITQHRPWVVLKWAMTLDGKVAAASGDSRWVSGEESRHLVHELRGRCMAVAAGIGTVAADNPMLNCRIEGMRQPLRIAVDSRASISTDSDFVLSAGEFPAMLVHTGAADSAKLLTLRAAGVRTLECPSSPDGHINLSVMLDRLGAEGIDSILVEGGPGLNWSFLDSGLADEFYIFAAPKLVGGMAAPGPVGGAGMQKMSEALPLEIDSVSRCGEDILIHAFPKNTGSCLQE